MLKRILCITTVIITTLCLCGCNRTAEYREPEQVIIISALGFDNNNGLLHVSIETVNTTNGEDEDGYKPVVIAGDGITAEQTIQKISDTLSGKLFLSHCAVIAVGKTVTGEQLGQILKYCVQEKELTLAVKIIATENAADLLSCKGYSGEAIGYDFLRLLHTKGGIAAPDYYAGLFYIESLRTQSNGVFMLPNFSVRNDGKEKTYYPNGVCVYKNDVLLETFNENQDLAYKILSNGYFGNTMTLQSDNGFVQARIEKIDCSFNPSFKNEQLQLNYNLDVTILRSGFIGDSYDAFCEILIKNLNDFLRLSQEDLKEDLLHITESIKKRHPLLYKKIAAAPKEFLLNADILVTCSIDEGDLE